MRHAGNSSIARNQKRPVEHISGFRAPGARLTSFVRVKSREFPPGTKFKG
jgi:hypothetical protein